MESLVNSVTDLYVPLVQRLRTFGAYVMDDDGNLSEFQPNQLAADAADMIERLLSAGNAMHRLIDSSIEWDTANEVAYADDVLTAWEDARRD